MIERLLLPLAILVATLTIGMVLAVSSAPASRPGTVHAVATVTADGPPTCCTQ